MMSEGDGPPPQLQAKTAINNHIVIPIQIYIICRENPTKKIIGILNYWLKRFGI